MEKEDLCRALRGREKHGFRIDNSEYWRNYYEKKFKNLDLVREKKYAKFLKETYPGYKKYLDVASGYGFLPLELTRLGIKVVCVDKFKTMREAAKNYFKSNGYEIEIVGSDITKMPFEKNEYEVVTAISILEHFPMVEIKKDVFGEINRVLKKGGILVAHVPIKSVVTRIKRWYRTKIKKDLPEWAVDDDGDVTHKIWFTADSCLALLKEMGYRVDYVMFNFKRSNEELASIKFLDGLLSPGLGKFYRMNDVLTWRQKLISVFASSVVFVCRKK